MIALFWNLVLAPHSLQPPPPPLSAGGLNLLLNFQKGGRALTGPQFLEGGLLRKRG